jgi:hypothetical protein
MNLLHVVVAGALLGAGANKLEESRPERELLPSSQWAVAPEYSWFHYEEPGLMEEDGTLYGVAVSYTSYYRKPLENRLLRLEGGVAAGEVDYDGQLQDGTPYEVTGNDEIMINARVLWGPTWQTAEWANQIYLGFGYRYLSDDSSHDPAGYRRHSNYFYVPLGARRDQRLGDNWILGLSGELDVLIAGLQVSEVPESPTDPSNATNWQWPGVGVRGVAELRCKAEWLDLSLAPFVQYWWVDDSQPSKSGLWIEPRNWSLQYGLQLIWRF